MAILLIFARMTIKKLFLLDALGALLSAFFLGVLLPLFQVYVGVPLFLLYILAMLAAGLALYSFSCFLLVKRKRYLHLLSMLNAAYCAFTLCLVILYFSAITGLGLAYFSIEILLILILIRTENKAAKQLNI